MGTEACENEPSDIQQYLNELPFLVDELVTVASTPDALSHVGPVPIPSREVVVDIIEQCRRIIFPGYFSKETLDPVNLKYYLGQETTTLFKKLTEQIILSVKHDCLRYDKACSHCKDEAQYKALRFIRGLKVIGKALASDIQAAFAGDPASKSFDEIIFSYPGFLAITVYRLAHFLYILEVPLIPRIMSEWAHGETGIDIHPGADIGDSFFIDHGTGVVVGETAHIGNEVRLYQGVTLGALSLPASEVDNLRDKKRHPTIEDNVIIYSNATILGPDAVIGARSIIGGNVWLTGPVPPDTKVLLKTPELIYIGNGK